MKRVIITEKQFKFGNQHLANTEQLDQLRKKLESLEGLVTKDKLRAWMQQVFILGQLLVKIDSKDIYAKEAVMSEYDNIIKKVDELDDI
ncbi:MAG: hypothetical protein IJ614_03155 [Prevotella sp.]|nr:hypothetical protein [Prevotella sp.]